MVADLQFPDSVRRRLAAGRRARSARLKKQKVSREVLRFTADEIVGAMGAVEKAGLTIYGVEITMDRSTRRRRGCSRQGSSNPKASVSRRL